MYTSFLTSHARYYRNGFGKSYHGIVATYEIPANSSRRRIFNFGDDLVTA